MAKFNFVLYGKEYTVNCGEGEEARLQEVIDFLAAKMQAVSERVGNTTEPRLLMLTCLQVADELLDLQRKKSEEALGDEDLIVAAVEHLKSRVAIIASQVGRA